MRNTYRQFVDLSEQEKSDICKQGVYVFDTNVLLNLYRYSQKTRNSLLSSIESVKKQIWMPDQIAYEFLKDRVNIINETNSSFESIKSKIDDFCEKCKNELRITEEAKITSLNKIITSWFNETLAEHSSVKKPSEDKILDELFNLFDGKTGIEYDTRRLIEINNEGEKRYANNTPPGYKDTLKDGNKYGDLVIWFQMIDYCKEQNLPLIFVTNDMKEDWWQVQKGKKYGPRHELRAEFKKETDNEFLIYTMESFIKLNDSQVDKDLVAEIQLQNSFADKYNNITSMNKLIADSYLSSLEYYRINETISDRDRLSIRMKRLSDKMLNCEATIKGITIKYEGRNMPTGVAKQLENTKRNLINCKREFSKINQYLMA